MHTSKDARGGKISSGTLNCETKLQVVQLMNIAFHPKLEKRHAASSIGFFLSPKFFCYSSTTTSLLSPYSYAIHGPIIKPSCSQFNTPESPSVIIIAVESSE